jgi:Domain of unknown function (DUF4153)
MPRFPSLSHLAAQAAAVLRRFPATLAVAGLAAATAIVSTTSGMDDAWARVAFVSALGLPLTIALTLVAEVRGWQARQLAVALGAGALGLAAFFATWPGMDATHDAVRFFQLAAVLHLVVAFAPFLATGESGAFWQYNRRMFLGFLRSVLFSVVLFLGIAVALGALDKLFGVDVESETYFRLWLIVALVGNTWIFLAAVPEDLPALERDTDYPRALKVFAQYILTPLVFTYLIILLAYLVKILAGGEWPSGWIGWLVASVAVTGLLGFLLVHPLRARAEEGWIRVYARWLFIGLLPAPLMLLAAFWKRIVPYGLTEPRVLGLVLGLWLLGVALLFTLRREASIRTIPVTLAVLLALTLYGPLGLTRLSVSSQGRRYAAMVGLGNRSGVAAREASAAIRFLMDRRAGEEIAARAGADLASINWDTIPRYSTARDSLAREILARSGLRYVPPGMMTADGSFFVHGAWDAPTLVQGFDWLVPVQQNDHRVRMIAGDSVSVVPGGGRIARIRVGEDTLTFDLLPLARRYADSVGGGTAPLEQLRVEAAPGARRGVLALSGVNGRRRDSLEVTHWNGWVLLGGNPP